MARLNVPDSIKEGLSCIASLTHEQYEELCAALENIPLRIKPDRILDDSELKLTTISSDKLDLIKDALFPLYLSREGIGVSPLTLVDDVAESMRERDGDRWPEGSEEVVNRLKERLKRLISLDRAKLVIKSNNILTQHARTYTSARVFTDIRPVFDDNVEVSPQYAVIVHMLKINHIKNRKPQEFVIALDAQDIQQLIDTLERAKKKAETVHTALSSTNIKTIDVV